MNVALQVCSNYVYISLVYSGVRATLATLAVSWRGMTYRYAAGGCLSVEDVV